MKAIEQQLKDSNGLAEYPTYVKALIMRQEGKIQESLQLFQLATILNPNNVANLKQVGRSLYVLGYCSILFLSVAVETEARQLE